MLKWLPFSKPFRLYRDCWISFLLFIISDDDAVAKEKHHARENNKKRKDQLFDFTSVRYALFFYVTL